MESRVRNKIAWLGLALALVGLVVVAACAPAAPPATPAAPTPTAAAKAAPPPTPTAAPTPTPTKGPPEKVTFAYPSFAQLFYPWFMARDKGYLAEEGLEVTWTQVMSAVSIKAMLSGAHEFDASSGTGQVAAVEGAPVMFPLIGAVQWPWYIWVKPGISSIQELKGKKIAVTSIGSSLQVVGQIGLRKYGLDPDKDVAWVGTGMGAPQVAALKGGAVDAAVAELSFGLELKPLGFKPLIFLGDEVKGWATGLTTTEKMIKERPGTVKKMVKGLLKGLKFYKSKSPQARDLYAKYGAEYAKLDRATATELYDADAKISTDDGWASDEILKASVDVLKQALGKTEDIPLSKIYEPRFVKEANEELKREGWQPR